MTEESFLLVSLREDKAKKLAQVINNDTCRKILDYLSKAKEGTETTIANVLNLPISTVHYNMQQLVENKLVTADEFHYSEKGKEIIHYKLANKLIIIAQDEHEKFVERLRKALPLGGFAVAGAGLVYLLARVWNRHAIYSFSSGQVEDRALNAAVQLFAEAAPRGGEAAEKASYGATQLPQHVTTLFPDPMQISLWFLAGSLFVIIIIILWKSKQKQLDKR